MKRGWIIFLALLPLYSLTLPPSALAQESVKVVDDFGRTVTIPREPLRIVSIAPSVTETLFTLGLGDRVVGVTSYCDYPPEVLERVGRGEIEVIGGFTNPSLEKIVALNPDLVVGTNLLTPEFVEKLEKAGIPVVVVKTADSIEGVYEDIMLIGRACWAGEKASRLVDELKSSIALWEEQVKGVEKVEAAEIAWVNPLLVAGNGTYIHDIIEHAGGRNVFSDKSWWSSISDEELVERDPDHIIVPYKHGQKLIYEGIMEMKEKGLIHGAVHLIDPDIISRPGPRLTILFEEVVKALHPEVWSRVVEAERLIAPGRAMVGDLLTVFVYVRNPGQVAGEKVVEIAVGGKTLSQTVALGPGEVKLVNFTFPVEEEGTLTINAYTLSAVVEVSPTAEKLIGEARKSFEEFMRKYVAEEVSSRVDPLAEKISLLEGSLDRFYSNFSGLSDELILLRNQVDHLSTIAMASTATSIVAIIVAVALAVYLHTRAKRV